MFKINQAVDEIYSPVEMNTILTAITATATMTTATMTTTTTTTTTITTTTTTPTLQHNGVHPIFFFILTFNILFVLFLLFIFLYCVWLCRRGRRVKINERVNERPLAREETFYLTAPSSEVSVPQSSIRASFISADSVLPNGPSSIKFNETFFLN